MHQRRDSDPRPLRIGDAGAVVRARPDTRDLEVIVVVDGANPATERTLAAIPDPRVRVIVSDAPRGGGGARNLGVGAARGTWIAFLDDDDVWLPARLERQLAAMVATGVDEPIASARSSCAPRRG